MLDKYFSTFNVLCSEDKETISQEKFQQLLKIRLDRTHSTTDLETVILKTREQFVSSVNDEMYIGDLFQEIYNPNKQSLDSKKDYVYNEFHNYFLTE